MPQIDKLNIRQQNSVYKQFLSLNVHNDAVTEHHVMDREEREYCPNCQGKLSHGTCNVCHSQEFME